MPATRPPEEFFVFLRAASGALETLQGGMRMLDDKAIAKLLEMAQRSLNEAVRLWKEGHQ